jgi:hypothetical protein
MPTMNLFDLYEVSRQPRRPESLYDRARKYIGAVRKPLKPLNTAAKAKARVRGIIAAKHTR